MEMEVTKKITTGGSDTRKRQEGSIVPASPRSCFGEPCVGLSALLAASSADEQAITGMMGACSAGAPIINAPAKEYEGANLASRAREEREEMGCSPL